MKELEQEYEDLAMDMSELDLRKNYKDSDVEPLTPRQVWFIRKHIREGDWTAEEIAADVDCQVETVYLIRNNKVYKTTGHYKSEFLSL
jgi:hypothetical protein